MSSDEENLDNFGTQEGWLTTTQVPVCRHIDLDTAAALAFEGIDSYHAADVNEELRVIIVTYHPDGHDNVHTVLTQATGCSNKEHAQGYEPDVMDLFDYRDLEPDPLEDQDPEDFVDMTDAAPLVDDTDVLDTPATLEDIAPMTELGDGVAVSLELVPKELLTRALATT